MYLIDSHSRPRKTSGVYQNLNNCRFKTFSSIPALLALSACGGGSVPSNNNGVTLSKLGNSYSLTSVQGLVLKDPSSSIIEINQASGILDSIQFQADGSGTIEFEFVNDTVELSLSLGSSISGFNAISLRGGSTDFTNTEFLDVNSLELSENANVQMGSAQLQTIQTVIINSIDTNLEIILDGEEELNSFLDLISSASIIIFAEGNPFVLTNGENSDISDDVLSAREIQLGTYVNNLNDAPDLLEKIEDGANETSILKLDTISFVGNPTGNVTVILDTVKKELVFIKGGVTSNSKIFYENIDVLSIPSGTTLEIKSSDLAAIDADVSGEGNIVVKDVGFETDLSRLKLTGDIQISGEAKASDLLYLDLHNSNTIDASDVIKSIGTASDLKNFLDDQTTIKTASSVSLVTSGAEANLTDLQFLAANTTGFVNAIVHSKVTGSVDEGYYVLATEKGQTGDKIQLSSSVEIDLNDDASTEVDASKLATIGASTTGDVNVINALNITGSEDELIAALDSTNSKVIAATSDVTIISAVETNYLSKLIKINDATSGNISLSNSGASTALQGSAADLQSGLSGIVSHSGSVTISAASTSDQGKDYLAQLKAINASTSGSITLTGTAADTELNGSASDLQAALQDISSHAASVTLTSASTLDSGIDYVSQLKAINSSTSGAITLSGSGASTALKGSAVDLYAALSGIITHTGPVTVSAASTTNLGEDYLTQLKAINASTSGSITLIDSGTSTTLQGSASDVNDALNGITTHDGNIIINSASASAEDYLSQLKLINSANTGTISLAFSGATNAISGSAADIAAGLSGIGDYVGIATVTTRLTALSANEIASKSKAAFSMGIEDSVANLVNSVSSDISSNLQNALADDSDANIYLMETERTQTATDIDFIENATDGILDLGLVNKLTLISNQSVTLKSSTLSDKIVTLEGAGDDGGEAIEITGSNSGETINLSNIILDSDDITSISVNAGTGADTIVGSDGADVINGGEGADIITPGLGSDVVILNASNGFDVIDLIESSGTSIDTIRIDGTIPDSAIIVNGWNSAGADQIKIDADDTGISLTNGATAGGYFESMAVVDHAANASGANDTIIEISQNLSAAAATAITDFQASQTSTTQTALIAAIVGSTGLGETFETGLNVTLADAADKVILLVDDGDESVMLLYTAGAGDGAADATLEAAEVQILAVFDGLVDLADISELV